VRGNGRTGFEALESDGVEVRDLQIDATDGPPYIIANSRNLRLHNLTTSRPTAGPMVRAENVENLLLADSHPKAGTPVLLALAGAGSRGVRLQRNDLPAGTEAVQWTAEVNAAAIMVEP
jgi:hypothetical protein